MTDRQFKSLRALIVGLTAAVLLLGASLLVGAPVSEAHAEGATTKWTCMVGDRLDDPEDAEDWKGARSATRALNKLASHVPAGTVSSFHLGNSDAPMVICIK